MNTNQLQTEWLDVTPELAKEFLKKNPDNNRKINEPTVNTYAADMKKDRWMAGPGSLICFDKQGILRDGQHRLNAILKSEVTIPMLIMRNVESRAMFTIDRGKKRTEGEMLQISGESENPVIKANTAKTLINLLQGKFTDSVFNRTRSANITAEDVVDFFYKNSEALTEAASLAIEWRRKNKFLPTKTLAAYYIIFSLVDKIKADEFFEKFSTSANLDEDNPILILISKFQRNINSKSKISQANKVALLVTAWNRFIQDKSGNFNLRKSFPKVEDKDGNEIQNKVLKSLSR